MDKEKESQLYYSTIEECEQIFTKYIEANLEHYAEGKQPDKLGILRTCIELLARLEDGPHHIFAGRVLIFLAKVLNLFDQSSLNLKSDISERTLPHDVKEHLDRIRKQTTAKDKDLAKLSNHDMEEGETISDDDDDSEASSPQEDVDKIYERFWKVQQLLYNPNQLYDKSSWFTFRTYTDTLIASMENKPTSTQVWNLKKPYMTDPKTLMLQFNDVYMRRSFLLQILIVLQYLEMPVDLRPEHMTLDKLQLSWLSTTVKRIYGLLDSMPNREEGRKFLDLVRKLLRREECWSKWKSGKCKEPKKLEHESQGAEDEDDMINMRGTYHKRRKVSDELSNAKPYNMHVIGSQDMSRLWNMKQKQLNNTPDLNKYIMIPLEKQAEKFKDPNYSFRVLRLLRKSPHFFIPTSAAIQSLEGYLKETTKNFGSLNSNQAVAKDSNNVNSAT